MMRLSDKALRRTSIGAMVACGLIVIVNTSVRPVDAQDVGVSGVAAPPLPSADAPPSEVLTAVRGASDRYAREDHGHARMTRSMVVTTGSGGTFSGTWSSPLAQAPVIVMTPVSASTSIDCQLTAAPTVNGFAGRCWSAQTTTLNLSIITAGLNLNPVASTASGVQIHVVALPPSQ